MRVIISVDEVLGDLVALIIQAVARAVYHLQRGTDPSVQYFDPV